MEQQMAHGVKVDSLSMEELQQLIADAQKALSDKVAEKRQALMKELSALDAIAKPSSASVKRASPQAKYRSQKNPDLTWAGRGGRPKWLEAEMQETEKPLEAFLIS
jgi:DNA-binding protein H-NS